MVWPAGACSSLILGYCHRFHDLAAPRAKRTLTALALAMVVGGAVGNLDRPGHFRRGR